MKHDQLKPCPFCGGKAGLKRLYNHIDLYVVSCLDCRMTPGYTFNRDAGKSIESWNTRFRSADKEA